MKPATAESLDAAIRIILIDDHQLLRAGAKALIAASQGFTVVGEACNLNEALDLLDKEPPDIVLLRKELRTGDGLDLLPQLLMVRENCRIIVLTDSEDSGVHRRAVLMGAIGVVCNAKPPEFLLKAISRVHAGEAWLDRSTTASLLGELSSPKKRKALNAEEERIASLTDREREVIKLVGEGLKNKQIAEKLFISNVTVHHHLTSIYSKLEVCDRLELLIYAYKHQLAQLPR
jgi:DNA-binding NarL/FixJ family response regulator